MKRLTGLLIAASAAIIAGSMEASAGQRGGHGARVSDARDGGAILCIAGCDQTPPVAVGRAPMTPTRPLSLPADDDVSYRMRNVWCGEAGSCVAVNHIAPPRLRDGHDISIAVFHRHW